MASGERVPEEVSLSIVHSISLSSLSAARLRHSLGATSSLSPHQLDLPSLSLPLSQFDWLERPSVCCAHERACVYVWASVASRVRQIQTSARLFDRCIERSLALTVARPPPRSAPSTRYHELDPNLGSRQLPPPLLLLPPPPISCDEHGRVSDVIGLPLALGFAHLAPASRLDRVQPPQWLPRAGLYRWCNRHHAPSSPSVSRT